eukprot:GHVR01177454.1.p1 GENE.GHVR01177454.1~~GHVR01177454.1.p1  ORF type:complete len:197 (-),score=40.70 GHVR01177454.1:22-612(-)
MLKGNIPLYNKRGPLFPGTSCFPLSPNTRSNDTQAGNPPTPVCRQVRTHSKSNRDQLNMIFNTLGTPTESDIEDIKKADAKKYIRVFEPRNGINLYSCFPSSSELSVNLLSRLLVFNPLKRITVTEALEHPLFKDMRSYELEDTSDTCVVSLPFCDWESMNEEELRYCFLREIGHHHREILTLIPPPPPSLIYYDI